ncbi:recombinase family protein [Fimbriiglobus ruber]|uniref:Recombinase n=1 Tax=Fimbriiglobus ruber TaxID=1908690 RepID=A0A225DE42_9BACT|nr:recombinase family protein [Fimbriiglobus ruber]OWK37904.1 Recombinase [Fimbriiglobus ruber]
MTATPDLAYSYMRFSTIDQEEGDTIRRQTAMRDAFVKRHGLELDNKIKLIDRGVKSFRGQNRNDKHALGQFLALVQTGKIRPQSWFIVESLDRLSREDVDEALQLLLSLTNAGIRVVQLLPVEVIYQKPVDAMRLIIGIMEMSRANTESKVKSVRVGEAWEEKWNEARSGKAQTANCPRWLRKVGDSYEPITDRAAAVKLMFELSSDGYGITKIIAKLKEAGHEPFGGGKTWNMSYIGRILTNRAVIGEFQPCREGKPLGVPIENYFTPVIEPGLFARVQDGLKRRSPGRKPKTKHGVNLFQSLLVNAPDHDRIEFKFFTDKRTNSKFARYVNSLAMAGQAEYVSFPVVPFETGILESLREIDPKEVLPQHDQAEQEVTSLAAQYADIETQLAAIEEQLVRGETVGVLVNAAKRLETKKRELSERLTEARRRAENVQSEQWGECQSLCWSIDSAKDQETARMRLRTALRRVVEKIYCVFVRDGIRQIAHCQIHFVGSTKVRHVRMLYRTEHKMPKRTLPMFFRWQTDTQDQGDVSDDVDFSKPDVAQAWVPFFTECCGREHWKRFEKTNV